MMMHKRWLKLIFDDTSSRLYQQVLTQNRNGCFGRLLSKRSDVEIEYWQISDRLRDAYEG